MPLNVPYVSSLKMEAAGTSVNSYQTMRYYVPKGGMARGVNIMPHKESIVHMRRTFLLLLRYVFSSM